jgi:S-DNA-T family DNA segregation ATPase FtsK/SpoIIIE
MSIQEKIAIRKLKNRLTDCFYAGDLYLKYKNGKVEKHIYPKIHNVDVTSQRLRYVFTIPNGLDPKEVAKKQYVFKQFYGKAVEIDTDDIKSYTLTVYDRQLTQSFSWIYDNIYPALDGKSLPIYCGKDLNNQHVIYDMSDSPHLLIAGETGSGKSTQVRSILTTLIHTLPPDRLELHLADMKRAEFHLFKNVQHVRSLSTKTHEIRHVLSQLMAEVENRESLLDKHEAHHVDDLPDPLPYILICIDEVALLRKEQSIMDDIEDISALGRALGIFLILSMQRPDSKVLDGKLKVNLTVRMGFRTADVINSRIIDTRGSEKIELKDRGRMIMKLERLQEVQAPFLNGEKAKKILDQYRVEKESEPQEPPKEKKIFGLL